MFTTPLYSFLIILYVSDTDVSRFCQCCVSLFHGTVTNVDKVDQHLNPCAAAQYVLTQCLEKFVFIV